MKYWKENLGIYKKRTITPEDLKKNRNLRRFKRIRTAFLFVNSAISLVALSLIITGLI